MTKQLILITGATGHLGFRTLALALQAGYRARVAHRKPEQVQKIKNTASVKPFLSDVEFVQVPDITADDAYVEAVKGIDFVIHVASPIYTGFDAGENNWQKLLYDPAKKGTLSILNAAATESNIKRVVITSSIVVVEPKGNSDRAGPYDLMPLPDAETMEKIELAPMAYRFSKILSHKAGTDFMQENSVHFDLVRVLPAYIQGANELYEGPEDLENPSRSGSNEGTVAAALGVMKQEPRITNQVLLDDVAQAHVLGLKPEVARGGDNLLIMGNGGNGIPWDDFVPIIEKEFPEAIKRGILSPKRGHQSITGKYDVTSSEKALGFKFAGAEEMAKSVVGQFVKLVEAK